MGGCCVDGHTYISWERGWGLSLAGVWVSYRAVEKMFGYRRGCTKAKKDKKKNLGVGAKEEEGRGERERRLKRRALLNVYV